MWNRIYSCLYNILISWKCITIISWTFNDDIREQSQVLIVNILEQTEQDTRTDEFLIEQITDGLCPVPELELIVHVKVRLEEIRYHLHQRILLTDGLLRTRHQDMWEHRVTVNVTITLMGFFTWPNTKHKIFSFSVLPIHQLFKPVLRNTFQHRSTLIVSPHDQLLIVSLIFNLGWVHLPHLQ